MPWYIHSLQFNILLANRTSALEARLRAIQDAAEESSLAEASMRDIAGEVALEKINSVKLEWLAEVCVQYTQILPAH